MSNNNDNDDINSKSNDNLRNNQIEDDFDIKNLLKIIIRRKKLAIVAATSIFLLNFAHLFSSIRPSFFARGLNL